MRSLFAIGVAFLLVQAVRGESVTVRIQETVTVEVSGATAAYTTNPNIADVTLPAAGHLVVTGHSAGTTQLVVVTAAETQSLLVTVVSAPLPTTGPPEAGVPVTRYEGRYSSGIDRLQNAIDIVTNDVDRRSEFHVLHIHDLRRLSDEPNDALAEIYYRVTTPERRMTFLDETVDVSHLTVSNTNVRGFHLRDGGFEFHGGYASSTLYDSFFLPAERRWVAGAGYDFDLGSTRLTPSVYEFFSEPESTTARRGLVGALAAEHRVGDTLYVRADVGVSRSVAAAGELRYLTPRTQFRAAFSLKPDDFPTLGLSELSGTHAELDGTRRVTDRFTVTSYGTWDRFRLSTFSESIGVASLGLRYSVSAHFALLGGADVSTVRTPVTSIRTVGLPFGLSYETSGFGLTGTYRLLDNSETSRRGDALRVSAHASSGRFSSSVWAERQRQAPTLDLIFNSTPGLELALLRLGVSVRSPEDLARALRDNAALIDLGYITGVNVDLTPRRLQAGFNLVWLGNGPRSDHFRFLAVYSQDEGVRTTRENTIATLSYSRRFLGATDLYGSYSWWQTTAGSARDDGTTVEVGLRQQFTGLPQFLQRSGTIEGFAFLDREMRGVRGPDAPPLPDLTVSLDGKRTTKTDGRGAYSFEHVSPGPHRVMVQLPDAPRAFFTTPSQAEAKVGAHVDFGLVWAAARIDGQVISDAGAGVGGVVLSAAGREGTPISATSDALGRFAFAVPAGVFRVALAAESLPAGYAVAGERERSVTVEPDRPQVVSFEVHALRSVAGRAAGASEVRIESLGRTARVDSEGNFVFRSMPAGTFTLTARSGGRVESRVVTLPPEPTILGDVNLGAPATVGGRQPAKPTVVVDTPSPALEEVRGPFRLQVGAFRLAENAIAAQKRMQRRGLAAQITRSGLLQVVSVGPFASREAAEAEESRLEATGIDAVVIAGSVDRAPAVKIAERSASGAHIVQAGAFRDVQHAAELLTRLQHFGEQALTTTTPGGLTVVYLGPFETRAAAMSANARLKREGVEGFVTRR